MARGVRIRIVLDDFNTSGKNAQVLKLAFEKNMEMRLFNPLPGGRRSLFFRLIGNLRDVEGMQRRMHNKIFVADNAVAITGGRNLGETYFGQSAGTNFMDIDLLAAGRMARDLSRSFDQYWNNPLAYPAQSLMTAEEIEALKAPPPTKPETATLPPQRQPDRPVRGRKSGFRGARTVRQQRPSQRHHDLSHRHLARRRYHHAARVARRHRSAPARVDLGALGDAG